MNQRPLSHQLGEYLDHLIEDPPHSPADRVPAAHDSRRSRWLLAGLAAVAACLVIVVLNNWGQGGQSPDPLVISDGSLETIDTPEPQNPGGDEMVWWHYESPPIGAREGMVSAWTGEEWLVWGGQVDGRWWPDGVALNPATGAWRDVPAAPLSGLPSASVFADGSLYLFYSSGESVVDVVVFDPITNTWSVSSSVPVDVDWGLSSDLTAAVVDGSIVVVGTTMADRSQTSVGRFDPEAGKWNLLPSLRVDGEITSRTVAVYGDELLVWLTAADPLSTTGFVIGSTDDDWTPLVEPGPDFPVVGATGLEVGARLLLWGGVPADCGLPDCGDQNPIPSSGAVIDPSTGAWSPMTPGPVDRGGEHAVSDGQRLLTTNEWHVIDDAGNIIWFPGEGAAYDPVTDRWSSLTSFAPDGSSGHHPAHGIGDPQAVVWAGDRYIQWSLTPGNPRGSMISSYQPLPDFSEGCVAPLTQSQTLPPQLSYGAPGSTWTRLSVPPPWDNSPVFVPLSSSLGLFSIPVVSEECEHAGWHISDAGFVGVDDYEDLDFRWFVRPTDENDNPYQRVANDAIAAISLGDGPETWVSAGPTPGHPSATLDGPLPGEPGIVPIIGDSSDSEGRWNAFSELEVGDKIEVRFASEAIDRDTFFSLVDPPSADSGLFNEGLRQENLKPIGTHTFEYVVVDRQTLSGTRTGSLFDELDLDDANDSGMALAVVDDTKTTVLVLKLGDHLGGGWSS